MENDQRKNVFVVHGRNIKARDALFAFLQSLQLNPIEWIEAVSNSGAAKTIDQIVTEGIKRADGIIILMTPDDEVSLRPELRNETDHDEINYRFQSRPNVSFEAGLAMGLLRDRTIFVSLGEVKPFSDIQGIPYLVLDNSPKSRHDLVTMLKSIGLDVNDKSSDFLAKSNFQEVLNFPWTLARITNYYHDYLEKWEKKVWGSSGDHKLAKSPVGNVMLDKTMCMIHYPWDIFSDIRDEMIIRMKLDSNKLPFVAVLKSKDSWGLAGVITPSDLAAENKFDLCWKNSRATAADIYTSNPYFVKLDMTWKEAEDYRKKMSIRSGLPVLTEEHHFVGWLPPAGTDFIAD